MGMMRHQRVNSYQAPPRRRPRPIAPLPISLDDTDTTGYESAEPRGKKRKEEGKKAFQVV